MLLQEAYSRERRIGEYKKNVRMIRRKIHQLGIDDMADLFVVSADNCRSVIDTINAHPDRDDERVAEEINWDR